MILAQALTPGAYPVTAISQITAVFPKLYRKLTLLTIQLTCDILVLQPDGRDAPSHPSAICNLSFVIFHLLSVIRHFSFALCRPRRDLHPSHTWLY
jgi:hypothetical protein